jgi:hypothetical protein
VLIEELDDSALVSQETVGDIDWVDSESASLDEVPSWLDEIGFEATEDSTAGEQQTAAEGILATSGMIDIGLRESDYNGQAEHEEGPSLGQEQLGDDLSDLVDEFQVIDAGAGEYPGLAEETTESEVEEWSWEQPKAATDEGFVPVPERSDEYDNSVERPIEAAGVASIEQKADDSSDELWADAMEELSKVVDESLDEDNLDHYRPTEGSDSEEFSADGWYDEITNERNVTDELPDWLQNSVESTQEMDAPAAQDLQEWMDDLPDESKETKQSTSNIPAQSTDPLRSHAPILSADSSIRDDLVDDVPSSDSLGGNLADPLSDNSAESEDPVESSSDELTDVWMSHPPGDSAIWLDEIAAEETLSRNEPDAELNVTGVGQQDQESEDQGEDQEENASNES